MIIHVSKQDLLNMLNGLNLQIDVCSNLEKAGYMRFTGNQWNPSWEWTKKLESFSDYDLYELYMKLSK